MVTSINSAAIASCFVKGFSAGHCNKAGGPVHAVLKECWLGEQKNLPDYPGGFF